jgi:hypothetical protein
MNHLPSPLDKLRQKSRKWMVTLIAGLLLFMSGAGLTANLLFFIGAVLLFGCVLHGISKDIRCPFCGLFDPVGMVRPDLGNLFKRSSTCPQCQRDLGNTE